LPWIAQAFGRTFKNWEAEIARPVVVAIITALALFTFSLLFAPVRQFLFDDTVPYPIYCTAETYSMPTTPTDFTSARTEFLFINMTDRDLSRSDLEKELSGAGGGPRGASPDLLFVYTRGTYGRVVGAKADEQFNAGKGELAVRLKSQDVIVEPRHFKARATLRVNVDVIDLDNVEIKRAAHKFVLFQIEHYEQACYTR
jgi:hypothetical protein